MNENEAKAIVTQLSLAYSNSSIAKDKNVAKYYLDKFLNLDYQPLLNAVTMLIDSSKNFPRISEIMEVYKGEYRKHDGLRDAFGVKCEVCDSKGFVLDRQIKEKKEYIYALYCSCELGEKYKNDMDSIESKFDIKDIIARRRKQSKVPPRKEVIAKVKAMLGGS